MQLSNVTDTAHLLMNDITGTLFRQQSSTQKTFRFRQVNKRWLLNVDYSVSLPQTPPFFLLSHVAVVDLGRSG